MTADDPVVRTPAVSGPPNTVARSLRALVVDAGLPVVSYLVAAHVFGLALVPALIAGSIPPVVTSAFSWARSRSISPVSALMLALNLAGIVLSFVAGNPRIVFAKDSGISSVFGVGVLISVLRGRPMMSAGLRPFVTKGEPDREGAWDRLASGSSQFRRYERRYSTIWALALITDCVARVACAFLAPLSILGWVSTPIVIAAVVAAIVVSGGTCVNPMVALVHAEAAEARRQDSHRIGAQVVGAPA